LHISGTAWQKHPEQGNADGMKGEWKRGRGANQLKFKRWARRMVRGKTNGSGRGKGGPNLELGEKGQEKRGEVKENRLKRA